ncbi:hypothetical protein Zmor_008021 [Zophobas morio]|uniref:Uncharacterized protein n=1 Tax=Zophobas morio TaxID=2755281 RepID=A0AA38IYM6_9CUCU|nr:hypothetical protein Zmor_008021 [Zophobas morio]
MPPTKQNRPLSPPPCHPRGDQFHTSSSSLARAFPLAAILRQSGRSDQRVSVHRRDVTAAAAARIPPPPVDRGAPPAARTGSTAAAVRT